MSKKIDRDTLKEGGPEKLPVECCLDPPFFKSVVDLNFLFPLATEVADNVAPFKWDKSTIWASPVMSLVEIDLRVRPDEVSEPSLRLLLPRDKSELDLLFKYVLFSFNPDGLEIVHDLVGKTISLIGWTDLLIL